MNKLRAMAGFFVGIGALLLIWKGEIALGASILSGMLGFFVGEHNGYRNAKKETES